MEETGTEELGILPLRLLAACSLHGAGLSTRCDGKENALGGMCLAQLPRRDAGKGRKDDLRPIGSLRREEK